MKINVIHSALATILLAAALLTINAQVTQRPRIAAAAPGPTATPVRSSTPSPTPIPPSAQTLEQLQTKIRQRLYSLDVRRGRVGVKIVSLATDKVVFENDSEKYFMPASNMKNFTVAAGF